MFAKFFSASAPLALAFAASGAVFIEPLSAQTNESVVTPAKAFLSLDGEWTGALTYRDYNTKKLESIPVDVTMEALPDDETMVQRYDYTDPGFQVYITNLIALRDGLLTGATARAGRPFETYEKRIEVTTSASETSWTAVLLSEVQDDGRPARIRETMAREGGTLTMRKDVDYLDDDNTEWVFRNEITLAAK